MKFEDTALGKVQAEIEIAAKEYFVVEKSSANKSKLVYLLLNENVIRSIISRNRGIEQDECRSIYYEKMFTEVFVNKENETPKYDHTKWESFMQYFWTAIQNKITSEFNKEYGKVKEKNEKGELVDKWKSKHGDVSLEDEIEKKKEGKNSGWKEPSVSDPESKKLGYHPLIDTLVAVAQLKEKANGKYVKFYKLFNTDRIVACMQIVEDPNYYKTHEKHIFASIDKGFLTYIMESECKDVVSIINTKVKTLKDIYPKATGENANEEAELPFKRLKEYWFYLNKVAGLSTSESTVSRAKNSWVEACGIILRQMEISYDQ